MTASPVEIASFASRYEDTEPMPRDRSGDFLSEVFENPVVETTPMYDDETSHAHIIKERVTMENGSYYEVTSTHAKHRTIDVGIVATAAWLTHDKGLNAERAERAASYGIDTVFISPQQNLDRIGHFGRGVCNIIQIADHMHRRADRDPDNLWVDGISQGAMHAYGVTAKAPYVDGKRVVAGDYTVACFPEGVDLRRDLAQLPQLAMNELGAATAFLKLPLSAVLHYPRTLAFHPKMLFQHAKQVPALLSGGAGDAAKHMPLDTFGHSTNYLGDIMGQGRRWVPILEQYDNLTAEYFKGGGHISLMDPRCQDKWERRLRAVHEVIESDPRIIHLGGAAMKEAVSHVSSAFSHRPIAA